MNDVIDLSGKRGLVVGIASEHSIATDCAHFFRIAGADLAITYLNEKAEPYVRAVAQTLPAILIMPCNVSVPGELEAVFARIKQEWGKLDFVFHSIAFAPAVDFHANLVDCSAEGFVLAMDVSCHSFIRMAKMALPLMTDGSSLMTLSFYGAKQAVDH